MAGTADRKRNIELTPPPRVKKVEPTALPGPGATGPRRQPLAVGWLTIATFGLLLAVAFGVFFYLPDWVASHGAPTPPSREPIEVESPAGVPPAPSTADRLDTLREQGELKLHADEILERVRARFEALEAKGASVWGGEAYRTASELIAAGDASYGDKDFSGATASYERASRELESLAGRAAQVLQAALRDGAKALSSGDAAAATEAFRLAETIEPANASARTGLERAKVLNDVVRLVASGEAYERGGDLERAAESYRRALALDPITQSAQQGLSRLDTRYATEAFTKAMSEAVAALGRKDYEAARGAFERAGAIRPDAAQVRNGLAQVEDGLRSKAIGEHREKARAFEAEEAWRSAAAEYQSVLDLDPTIRFAREGRERSTGRADLAERLQFHISNPDRLSDERVLREASGLLARASSVEPAGPKLREQVDTLGRLLARFSVPVRVRLISDDLTEVLIYKVGRLGTFTSRDLELRPGVYKVVGTRSGYRDVRVELVVAAGREPAPLVIRCEEKI